MRMSKKIDKEEEIDRWFIDDEDDDDDDEEEVYNKENEWSEEDESASDEAERVLDENDLTQLPGVDISLAKKLKREGYSSLWDIACGEVEDLVNIIGVTSNLAKKMVEAANELLVF